jgi:large subunit ribosomal protein L6
VSRIGKRAIQIPDGVDVQMVGLKIKISKGPHVLEQQIHPDMTIKIDKTDKTVSVSRPTNNKLHRSYHGLYRALINNMIIGVTTGFDRKLEIVGVGFRAELKGKNLNLNIGFSHPILFYPPPEVQIVVETPTNITIKGWDKQLVGQVAAKIRSFKPPEPYKGKGIRYVGEYVRKKAGKAAG